MFSQKKPYTAVTVTVERLTDESLSENDLSGIPDLVEIVNLQETGPTEAARAIRKKLKYGNLHRQLRALTILDGLIQNAGPRFQRTFADEMLLERLRFCGTAEFSDPEVKKKCAELFRSWAVEYKNVRGMERIASLYNELPRRKHAVTQARSKVLKETENPFGADEGDETQSASADSSRSPSSVVPERGGHGASSSLGGSKPAGSAQSFLSTSKDSKKKKDKNTKKKHKSFNLEAEKEQMKSKIAEASIAATNLMNTLQSINREQERISNNQAAVQRFEACKQLRRQILRYIHHIESEQWLGSLLHANDELVTALMTYEQLDRSIDADSDSDDELAEQVHLYRLAAEKGKGKEPSSPTIADAPAARMASLSLEATSPRQPPRPAAPPRPSVASKPKHLQQPKQVEPEPLSENDDEDDPFADRNEV